MSINSLTGLKNQMFPDSTELYIWAYAYVHMVGAGSYRGIRRSHTYQQGYLA